MDIADSLAAFGTMAVLCLTIAGRLEIWHIYLVNAIVGCSNAFQQPASSVAVFRLVPEEKLEVVSGMNSFSMNLVTIASPVFAAFCYGVFGMGSVLLIDIVSFMAAFLVLLFLIKIEEEKDTVQKTSLFSGTTQGWQKNDVWCSNRTCIGKTCRNRSWKRHGMYVFVYWYAWIYD